VGGRREGTPDATDRAADGDGVGAEEASTPVVEGGLGGDGVLTEGLTALRATPVTVHTLLGPTNHLQTEYTHTHTQRRLELRAPIGAVSIVEPQGFSGSLPVMFSMCCKFCGFIQANKDVLFCSVLPWDGTSGGPEVSEEEEGGGGGGKREFVLNHEERKRNAQNN